MNNIVIEGRLAQDPETKQTQNGKMMTTFNIACDRQYDKEHVDFFHCLSFGQVADYMAKYGTTRTLTAQRSTAEKQEMQEMWKVSADYM